MDIVNSPGAPGVPGGPCGPRSPGKPGEPRGPLIGSLTGADRLTPLDDAAPLHETCSEQNPSPAPPPAPTSHVVDREPRCLSPAWWRNRERRDVTGDVINATHTQRTKAADIMQWRSDDVMSPSSDRRWITNLCHAGCDSKLCGKPIRYCGVVDVMSGWKSLWRWI